jgi:hypothetical protein
MLKGNRLKVLVIIFYLTAALSVVAAIRFNFFLSEGDSKPGLILTIFANLLLAIGTGLVYREEKKRLKAQRENDKQPQI